MNCSTPGLPVHHQLLGLTQTHVHWVGDAIQPSHPLSAPSPAFSLSSIRVFSSESVLCIRWLKCWSFSFSISPSSEYSGLISFRMDWLDLLAVQGISQESSPTPQFKSINSSALSFLYSPTLTSIHDYCFFFSNVKKSKNLYSQVYKFMFIVVLKKTPYISFLKKNMYLFGMLGLSCGTRDLSSSLQLAGFLVAVCTLFF